MAWWTKSGSPWRLEMPGFCTCLGPETGQKEAISEEIEAKKKASELRNRLSSLRTTPR